MYTVLGVALYVYEAWRFSMRSTEEPAHILYRRALLNKMTRLIGQTVSIESHPRCYNNWTTWEVCTFNSRLVAPEAISPLIKALDAEHCEMPVFFDHKDIEITGWEPIESNDLDWSKLEL
jgi:hypothetical protein